MTLRLADITAGLVHHEERPGQERMAELVEDAIADDHHLVVQAGTGTGKTLAYLLPAVLSGKRTIVSTATKALQDQIATKDLPFLAAQLAEHGIEVSWTILKGRSNYLCRQRLKEAQTSDQLDLDDEGAVSPADIARLVSWDQATSTGDQAELDWSPSDAVWNAVSVGSDECPGAQRCPEGQSCWAEQARRRAADSKVIVVNTFLYGLHVGSEGAILPDHDIVIFDEAHVLEDVMSDTIGVQLAPGRFISAAASIGRFLEDRDLITRVISLADRWREVFADLVGQRLTVPFPEPVFDVIDECRVVIGRAGEDVDAIETDDDDARQRQLRAHTMLDRLLDGLNLTLTIDESYVPFVSGRRDSPRLEVAPLDVGPVLNEQVWDDHVAILTSATIPSSLPRRIGLDLDTTVHDDVGSPFDYEHQALLYCPVELPPPRSPRFRDHVADELVHLISAAGGRTLALFTSWAGMDAAIEAVTDRLEVPILTQRDLPKPALIKAFAESEATCLFATTGLFQGIDVPGRTLSLVVIDKLPFPRPDDPLLGARRDQIGAAAFSEIDIPRAATLLAQACGRLIRTGNDRGVVAVLDSRLGTARYRWSIVNALPPMTRTRHRDEVERFLSSLDDA
ncbi:MAG: ATP-dependent helicase [Ilumatobacter coccineus]|uniref:DNA 5'-3' helicase n=1 Tax=Ilumatobacter coccineus TaxID=467094 RepID=A0A2G6K9Q7_9ACTN|nr:MAG: ATP-dependent helicase [Ilumatobacter coccineus]